MRVLYADGIDPAYRFLERTDAGRTLVRYLHHYKARCPCTLRVDAATLVAHSARGLAIQHLSAGQATPHGLCVELVGQSAGGLLVRFVGLLSLRVPPLIEEYETLAERLHRSMRNEEDAFRRVPGNMQCAPPPAAPPRTVRSPVTPGEVSAILMQDGRAWRASSGK